MNIKNLIAVAAIAASAMVSTHSFADTNITENVTLTADTDWSGLGLVTVESGVTVELSGCKLSLDGLAGEGSIVTTAVVGEDLGLAQERITDTRINIRQHHHPLSLR